MSLKTQKSKTRRTGVIARKVGMMGYYAESGDRIPVTVLKLESCQVVAHKTEEVNGYSALQLGAGEAKINNTTKPQRGVFAKAQITPKKKMAEFRITPDAYIPVGAEILADHFVPGQYVDAAGITIGKGFAGPMKRWNFGGLRATHGVSLSHRSHGSTGGRQDPGKTFKNKKMAGHLGVERETIQNLMIVGVDVPKGVIFVKGAVPGFAGGIILLKDAEKKHRPKDAPIPGAFKTSHATPEGDAAEGSAESGV